VHVNPQRHCKPAPNDWGALGSEAASARAMPTRLNVVVGAEWIGHSAEGRYVFVG
jgi:hypothetical protein